MQKIPSFLLILCLGFCVGFSATGCKNHDAKNTTAAKTQPTGKTTGETAKPSIALSAADVVIDISVDQNDTTADAKGVVTVSVDRKQTKSDDEIAITFDVSGLPAGIKIQDATIKAKEVEAKAEITVPKGTTVSGAKSLKSKFLSADRSVGVLAVAGSLRGETSFKLTLNARKE